MSLFIFLQDRLCHGSLTPPYDGSEWIQCYQAVQSAKLIRRIQQSSECDITIGDISATLIMIGRTVINVEQIGVDNSGDGCGWPL